MDNLQDNYMEAASKSQGDFGKKLAEEWGLVVDNDLHDLLILPGDEQRVRMLEAQIIEEGCRDALVVWKETGIIVDGNTRYDICKRNDVPFAIYLMHFDSKSDAMQWAKDNQSNRRNMTQPELAIITHKIADVIRAEAEERLHLSQGRGKKGVENFPQVLAGKSRDQLGAMAGGVSGRTFQKQEHIIEEAPEAVREAWRNEQITTDAAYKVTKLPKQDQQEIVSIIEKGEDIKKGMSDVFRRSDSKTSNNPRGWTKEDRENRKLTHKILEFTHSAEIPDYTLEMLIEDMKLDADNFFSVLRNRLTMNAELVNRDESHLIGNMIDNYIVIGVTEIRRKVS